MLESKGTLQYHGVDLYFDARFHENRTLYDIEIHTYYDHPTTGRHLICIDTAIHPDARLACEIEAEALLEAEHQRAEQEADLWKPA
jgi:hypothetical protein